MFIMIWSLNVHSQISIALLVKRPTYWHLTAQLKCLYTNASSTGDKREELEATMLLESYDLDAIIETWRDESHDWNAAMDSYRLFRRNTQGRRDGSVSLYIKKWIELEKLSLKSNHEQVESLWVRNKATKGTLWLVSTKGYLK